MVWVGGKVLRMLIAPAMFLVYLVLKLI